MVSALWILRVSPSSVGAEVVERPSVEALQGALKEAMGATRAPTAGPWDGSQQMTGSTTGTDGMYGPSGMPLTSQGSNSTGPDPGPAQGIKPSAPGSQQPPWNFGATQIGPSPHSPPAPGTIIPGGQQEFGAQGQGQQKDEGDQQQLHHQGQQKQNHNQQQQQQTNTANGPVYNTIFTFGGLQGGTSGGNQQTSAKFTPFGRPIAKPTGPKRSGKS